MAIFHCNIKIVSRGKGRSALASAAYLSGSELYNAETGTKHNYKRKNGVALTEILLPENAPAAYRERQNLWSAVHEIESRENAQLARSVEVALPVEMTREEQIECVRGFIRENFTDVGMCADWALHDKGDGNPHAHILLTVRGFEADGSWAKKQKSAYALDENGNKIPVMDPETGEQKVRIRQGKGTEKIWLRISVPSNDWNDHSKAEEWRRSWAEHCNRYLEPEQQIDHRSLERQGIEREPTIHEGSVAREMEERGTISERRQMNREIVKRNTVFGQLKETMKELTESILTKARELIERFKRLEGNYRTYGTTGKDDEYDQKAEEREQKTARGEFQHSEGYERYPGLARHIAATKSEINRTESEIKRRERWLDAYFQINPLEYERLYSEPYIPKYGYDPTEWRNAEGWSREERDGPEL